MQDIYKIKRKLRKNLGLCTKIATLTGLRRAELIRKLSDPKKFTLGELIVLKKMLNLSLRETVDIFAPDVAVNNSKEGRYCD